MLIKTKLLFVLLLGLIATSTLIGQPHHQCNILVQNEKEAYSVGDTIVAIIMVKIDNKLCKDANDAPNIYTKGLKMVEHSNWRRISDSELGEKLVFVVTTKRKEKVLTVCGETAYYNCFRQKIFAINN